MALFLNTKILILKNKHIKFLLIVLINIIFNNSLCKADDPQLWIFNNLNFVKESDHELTLTMHGRFVEGEDLSLYQFQPKYAFSLHDYFWGAFNYSFFGVKNNSKNVEDEDIFSNQHRLEIELQPRFQISELFKYTGRNRLEYLMNEDINYLNHRFRHRSVISFEGFKDSFGILVSQSEVFYDFGQENWNQFRTAPLGVRFKIKDFQISFLPSILSLRKKSDNGESNWSHSYFSSFELSYDF